MKVTLKNARLAFPDLFKAVKIGDDPDSTPRFTSIFIVEPAGENAKALLAAVPDPNLSRKLDFDALMQGKASDPSAWPGEFRIVNGAVPAMVEVGNDHLVRARA